MTGYDLNLGYRKPPLSLNDRMHWAEKNTWARQIKDDTHTLALKAKLPKAVPFATVTLVYYPPDGRARDEDNLTATLKPAVDGLVRYGLVEDDDSTHITSRCEIAEIRRPGEVHLRIEVNEP